jgi:hypothetical protein
MRRTRCLPTIQARTARPRPRRSSSSRASPCSVPACDPPAAADRPLGPLACRQGRPNVILSHHRFSTDAAVRAFRPSMSGPVHRQTRQTPPIHHRQDQRPSRIPSLPCQAGANCRVSCAPDRDRLARHPSASVASRLFSRRRASSPARRPATRRRPGSRGTGAAPSRLRNRGGSPWRVVDTPGGSRRRTHFGRGRERDRDRARCSCPPSVAHSGANRRARCGDRQAVSSPSGASSNFATASAPRRPCGSIDAGR